MLRELQTEQKIIVQENIQFLSIFIILNTDGNSKSLFFRDSKPRRCNMKRTNSIDVSHFEPIHIHAQFMLPSSEFVHVRDP